MRISDWSSDVCSSDLAGAAGGAGAARGRPGSGARASDSDHRRPRRLRRQPLAGRRTACLPAWMILPMSPWMPLVLKRFLLPASLLLTVSACGIGDWFGEDEASALAGERIAILASGRGRRDDPAVAEPGRI